MKLEIEVISKEVVTPSSPTPLHLKNYKLSFIDQLRPALIMPSALFYPANNDTPSIISNSERSNRLKQSLSKALTLFYPLAGRLVENSYVHCNDEGVTYVEAQANCKLLDVVTNPIPEQLSKLFPCDPEDGRDLCLVVQVTFFSCGGLAIGAGRSHKLADATSYFMFVNSWAAISRDDQSPVQSPKFESAILFPPKDFNGEPLGIEKKGSVVSKMFSFSPQKISDLRDKYTQGLIRPTRFETLSAFIGTRLMVATDDSMTRNDYGLRLTVGIRTRVVPPLSEYHFGNMIVTPVITLPPLEKDDEYGGGIVMEIRDAIESVNGDDLFAFKNPVKKEAVIYGFTTVCSFPLNKADFGWGIPIWFGYGSLPVKNTVCFLNSLSKGGIDALVTLKEEDMTKFEDDEVLLEYVSFTK